MQSGKMTKGKQKTKAVPVSKNQRTTAVRERNKKGKKEPG
jgi:hypothetical protein